ncbi:uncharacterized protein [Drosophila takahashii]|uniref:uncharacterized protein n=1 Tax=Drosophila takahashii TaxID=29030 RepID=UPI001CF84943|nr:uncharacterized protein LOC108054442 [Drosophila takahashii]
MWPIYTVFLGLSVLFILPQDVIGTCSISTEPNAPIVVTRFGSKLILSDSGGSYTREEGETIELFCGSGFSRRSRNHYGSQMNLISGVKLTMYCGSNGYFQDERTGEAIMNIKCQKGVLQMFESRTSLQNCKTDMTLVLGQEFNETGSIKSAALCYDIVASQLKYIGYTTFPTKNRILAKTQLGQLNDIGFDINASYQKDLIKAVSQAEIDAYMTKDKQLTQLFVGETFQTASLVQDEAIGRQLAGYEDMMSTIWMRTLRSGNWKNWVAAMRDATASGAHFDVRLGVSGVLELPMAVGRPCNASRSLRIELADDSSYPIPAHIWAHVHALEKTGGVQDEFVIIGHNSPFFRGDNLSDFCPSMCDQVSWLRNSLFAGLHEFPAYGLVQCCRVEDVASKLDNFPGAFAKASATATGNTAKVKLLDLFIPSSGPSIDPSSEPSSDPSIDPSSDPSSDPDYKIYD